MKLETFFEKFDVLAEMPGAVGKIRGWVLDLAASGRLLPREGEWQLRPLKALTSKIGSGSTPSGGRDSYFSEGVPLIRSMNIHFVGFNSTGLVFLSNDQAKQLSNVVVEFNDVLLNITGASIGRVTTAPLEMAGARVNQHVTIIRAKPEMCPKFLSNFLASPSVQQMIDGIQVGATRQALTKAMIEQFDVPVPPVAEQKRFVAKVDELMALCDRLEAHQQERETHRATLVHASLAQFVDAPTPANLHYLFNPCCSISPAALRKAIINLAQQGKLVAQDARDEPASDLLARIESIRNENGSGHFPGIEPHDAPYEIPASWVWTRLGNVSLGSDSGWSPQCLAEPRKGTNWGVLKISAVSWGSFNPDENKALLPGTKERADCEVKEGDFLISRANTEELVARSVIVGQTPSHLMMSDKIVRFRFPDAVDKEFVNLANGGQSARDYYSRNASGTSSSMKNIGRGVMCNLPIPLPPLPEQRRIMARTNHLFALIDKLESKTYYSNKVASEVLDALIINIETLA